MLSYMYLCYMLRIALLCLQRIIKVSPVPYMRVFPPLCGGRETVEVVTHILHIRFELNSLIRLPLRFAGVRIYGGNGGRATI